MSATITVRHHEDALEMRSMNSTNAVRIGADVHGEITYAVADTALALAAVERLAESLRQQIADAAESSPR